MFNSIALSVVLKTHSRTAENIALVEEIASKLGFEVTGRGTASISVRLSPSRFAELFGKGARPIAPRRPGKLDYGAPGGFESEDLPVPSELSAYIESISVQPPATRLSGDST